MLEKQSREELEYASSHAGLGSGVRGQLNSTGDRAVTDLTD